MEVIQHIIVQHIIDTYNQLKGTFILCDCDVRRLIGLAEDHQDCYYVLWDGRKFTFITCVMGLAQLKGKISDRDYQRLVRVAKLNHWDQLSRSGLMAVRDELKFLLQNNNMKLIKGPVLELD